MHKPAFLSKLNFPSRYKQTIRPITTQHCVHVTVYRKFGHARLWTQDISALLSLKFLTLDDIFCS